MSNRTVSEILMEALLLGGRDWNQGDKAYIDGWLGMSGPKMKIFVGCLIMLIR